MLKLDLATERPYILEPVEEIHCDWLPALEAAIRAGSQESAGEIALCPSPKHSHNLA